MFTLLFNNKAILDLTQGGEPAVEVRVYKRDSGKGAQLSGTDIVLTIGDEGNNLTLFNLNSVLAGRGIMEARFTATLTNALTAGRKDVQVSGTLSDGKAFVATASNAVNVRPRFFS